MNPEAKIIARLEEVLESIFCPVSGCWCLHGGHYEYYYDDGCECHVLEVWPVGFEEPEEPGGNGRKKYEGDICYEFALWDPDINDLGHVAFIAGFTDGTCGVVLVVPEPSTIVCASLGMIVLLTSLAGARLRSAIRTGR